MEQRVCILDHCSNVIVTEYNDQGKAVNNRRIQCGKCTTIKTATECAKQNRDISRMKKRAEKKNVPFNLTVAYIRSIYPEDGICPVLGVKMTRGEAASHNYSPSVDRIKPELGYVKGNVVYMSNLANKMKQNATDEQLRAFAHWILNN